MKIFYSRAHYVVVIMIKIRLWYYIGLEHKVDGKVLFVLFRSNKHDKETQQRNSQI